MSNSYITYASSRACKSDALTQQYVTQQLPASNTWPFWLGLSAPAGVLIWRGLSGIADPTKKLAGTWDWKGDRGRPEGWVCAKGEWLFLKEPWLSLVGVAVVHAPAIQTHSGGVCKKKRKVYALRL